MKWWMPGLMMTIAIPTIGVGTGYWVSRRPPEMRWDAVPNTILNVDKSFKFLQQNDLRLRMQNNP